MVRNCQQVECGNGITLHSAGREQAVHLRFWVFPGVGGIGGTMLDAFQLIHNAREYGPRVALFGHKVNPLESPLDFIEVLRLVVDGEGKTMDTVKAYNGVLQATGIKPQRPLQQVLQLSTNKTSYGWSP